MKAWIEVLSGGTEYGVWLDTKEESARIGSRKTRKGAFALANRWAVGLGGMNAETGKVEPLEVKDLTGGE